MSNNEKFIAVALAALALAALLLGVGGNDNQCITGKRSGDTCITTP